MLKANSKKYHLRKIRKHLYKTSNILLKSSFIAQSAGAVEYTDCTSAEG